MRKHDLSAEAETCHTCGWSYLPPQVNQDNIHTQAGIPNLVSQCSSRNSTPDPMLLLCHAKTYGLRLTARTKANTPPPQIRARFYQTG